MKLISSKEITSNRIFTVTMDHAVDPSGFEIRRANVQHRGSAVVMPLTRWFNKSRKPAITVSGLLMS